MPYTNKLIGGSPIGLMILLVKHLQIKLLKLDLGNVRNENIYLLFTYIPIIKIVFIDYSEEDMCIEGNQKYVIFIHNG